MFASALMDMSFYQTDVYIVDLQNKYLESALDEITELLRQQKAYCPKIRTIIEKALAHSIDRCCGKQGWAVVNAGGSEEQFVVTEVVSPILTRMHTVTFDRSSAIKVVSCSCHEFTRMEVTCPGIVAVLKSQGEDPYDAKWLTEHWRLSYHPLWYKAMQRLAPLTSLNDEGYDEGSQALDEPEAQRAIVSRVAKIAMIPVPTHANLRRAQMNDAFNTLRDDFDVPDCPDKYRQVMAMIFDLRSCFKGSPGQWVQDPLPPGGSIVTQSWSGDQRARPPINQANFTKRPAKKSQSEMTVREHNKKQRAGEFPTVAQRREEQGDWTLFLPTKGAATFMCPLPGCIKKPIKNSDQGRYHHRRSQHHQTLLIRYPRAPAPGIPGLSADVHVAFREPSPAEGGTPAAGIQGTDNDHVDEEVADSFRHASEITDSVREEVRQVAPTDPTLPLAANVVNQAQALMEVLQRRQEGWTRVPPEEPFRPRGPAWSLVNAKPADRLPFMDGDAMSNFRVNQFCEECSEWQLCSAHEALASIDNVDFIAKHVEAMKATGYVMVECGGAGDCFYHSMLFLASIYDQELYREWHDHDNFRKNTCDNLLVMLCLLMFLTILILYVSRFPTICL